MIHTRTRVDRKAILFVVVRCSQKNAELSTIGLVDVITIFFKIKIKLEMAAATRVEGQEKSFSIYFVWQF